MGVKDLWTILAPVKKHQPIASLKGQTIAVDLSIWVCESVTVKHMQGKVLKPHLRNLFFRVSNLLQLGINLIFVIDGEAPELKWDEMSRRTQARYGAPGKGKKQPAPKHKKGGRSNFKVWLRECQEMLSHLGVPCVQSKGEAEAMCALLNNQGIADGCLTEDGDAFLYGAHTVYRNFTLNTKDPHVDCFTMTDIRRELGLSRDKLITLALLLGCDYLPKGVVGVGKEQGCQLMKQMNGINVLERFEQWANGDIGAHCLSQTPKPSHCKVCNHIGTGKQHRMHGCVMCGTSMACLRDLRDIIQCDCQWHVAQNNTDITQVERDVMRKAMKTAGFPFKPVISEYLDRHEVCPSSPLRWERPQLLPLQKFNLLKLEWPHDYTLDKVFPLITLYDLTNLIAGKCKEKCLVLDSFVKTRTRQGVPCIEARWQRPDWDGKDSSTQFYNTIEREDHLSAAYADKYREFMEGKETKKSGKSKGKKKQKANPDVDSDLVSSQQPTSAVISSTAVYEEDSSLDGLISGVMSLDISKSETAVVKETKPEASSQTTNKMPACLHNGIRASKKLPLSIESLTRSENSVTCDKSNFKTKNIKKKTYPSCGTATTKGKAVRKEIKKIHNRQSKSANSSDIDFLDELLQYEASQKESRSSLVDTPILRERLTEENNEAEVEILPLFERIRLKSARGTSKKGKGSTGPTDFEQTNHVVKKEESDRTNEHGGIDLRETVQNAIHKCDVIVIDSDSDEEDTLKFKDLKEVFPNSADCSLAQVTDSLHVMPNLCLTDLGISQYQSMANDATSSSSNDDDDDYFAATLEEYPSAVSADSTAVADYKLIQPDVTEVVNDVAVKEEDVAEVTSSHCSTPDTPAASAIDPQILMPGDKLIAQKSTGKQLAANLSPEDLSKAAPLNSTKTPILSHIVNIRTPSFEPLTADITASSMSSSSYWCDNSQMSLFDSPSVSHVDLSSSCSSTEKDPVPMKHAESKGDEEESIAESTFSPFPCVIDLDTPDIPEPTSIKSENDNHRRLFHQQHNSKACKPALGCESLSHAGMNSLTVSGIVSPFARDIETPEIPDNLESSEVNQNLDSKCTLSIPNPSDDSKHASIMKITKQEFQTNHESEVDSQPQPQPCDLLDDNHTACSTSHSSINPGNVTFMPVPLNCDTPLLSLLTTPSSSSSSNMEAKENAHTDHVTTPCSRKLQHRPHLLQMDQLLQNTSVQNYEQTRILHNDGEFNKQIKSIQKDIGAIKVAGLSARLDVERMSCFPEESRVENTPRPFMEDTENSPVCLLDRLRKKFDQCGDKKATLTAMTQRSKPRL